MGSPRGGLNLLCRLEGGVPPTKVVATQPPRSGEPLAAPRWSPPDRSRCPTPGCLPSREVTLPALFLCRLFFGADQRRPALPGGGPEDPDHRLHRFLVAGERALHTARVGDVAGAVDLGRALERARDRLAHQPLIARRQAVELVEQRLAEVDRVERGHVEREPIATLDELAQQLGPALDLGDHLARGLGHLQRRALMAVRTGCGVAGELGLRQLARRLLEVEVEPGALAREPHRGVELGRHGLGNARPQELRTRLGRRQRVLCLRPLLLGFVVASRTRRRRAKLRGSSGRL